MSCAGKDVVFVLGGPGSGKGTQAISASKEFSFGYVCAGEVLRQERDSGTERGKKIGELMMQGELVPPEMVVQTLIDKISQCTSKYFLMDGFPRSIAQDDAFRLRAGQATRRMIVLDVPDEVLISRILARQQGRSDDNEEVARKRLASYTIDTGPVLQRYEKEGKLIRIDGNRSVEEVKKDFLAELRKFWKF